MLVEMMWNRSYQAKNEEEKRRMIFWKPKTKLEKKLLELYGVEEDDIQDHNQNRSQGEGKGRNPGQEFEKAGKIRRIVWHNRSVIAGITTSL